MHKLFDNSIRIFRFLIFLLFMSFLTIYKIARDHGQLWHRYLIPVLIYIIHCISQYYEKQLNLNILHVKRKKINFEILIRFIILYFFILLFLIMCYISERLKLNACIIRIIVLAIKILTGICGYLFSHLCNRQQQYSDNFYNIQLIKIISLTMLFCTFLIEYLHDKFFIFITPLCFIYALGAFFHIFMKPYQMNVFYIAFLVFVILFFWFDVCERMELIGCMPIS